MEKLRRKEILEFQKEKKGAKFGYGNEVMCDNCKKFFLSILRCGRCRLAWYCTPECQKVEGRTRAKSLWLLSFSFSGRLGDAQVCMRGRGEEAHQGGERAVDAARGRRRGRGQDGGRQEEEEEEEGAHCGPRSGELWGGFFCSFF